MDYFDVPIEDTVELDRNYPRVHERYFTQYYYIKEKNKSEQNGRDNSEAKGRPDSSNAESLSKDDSVTEGGQEGNVTEVKKGNDSLGEQNREDTCALIHSNKLCLLTLSHHHPVLSKKKEITKINYDVGKFNRLENQVSGKGKRGAQMMGLRSPVCIITCSDGSTYTVLAGVNGKLIEVNERLLSNPQLLSESPKEEGYLAVVLPPLRNGKAHLNRLLSKEEYEAMIGNSEEELVKLSVN